MMPSTLPATEAIQNWQPILAWLAAMAIAWLIGEYGQRRFSLPRISGYAIAGFLLGGSQFGVLPASPDPALAGLVDIAFALILFELGYRINFRWLLANPWIGATSLLESAATFVAVLGVTRIFDLDWVPSLILASLSISTSPAAVIRVANDLRAAGQVTERMLHLTAFNCLLAVIVFKVVLGYWVLDAAGSVFEAIWQGLVVMLASAGLGALFGVSVPGLLRFASDVDRQATVAFALAVVLLTALTLALQFSPLVAALTFGLVARHRRVVLSQAERNFGVLGDLLTILLFLYVAAILDWHHVLDGLPLAAAIILARLASKLLGTSLFARVSGITLRKGLLTGMALMPLSVFAILMLEQSRHLGIEQLNPLPGIAAVVLILELVAPLATRWALVLAGEAPARREN